MSRLLLIRHGQTTSNVRQALDTALPGAALTDLGWSQAFTAGEMLAGEQDESASPLSLVSSQALRARQTAAGIATAGQNLGLRLAETGPGTPFARALGEWGPVEVTGGIDREDVGPPRSAASDSVAAAATGTDPVSTTLPLVMPGAVPGISEIPAGRYEMREDHEAHYDYHRTFAEWLGGAMDVPVPGASTGREVVERYLDTLLPLAASVQRAGSDLAVVSHGAVIRLVAAYLGRVDPEYAVRTLMPNTSRVELEIPDVFGDGASFHTDALASGWKVVDWAGHGEPVRAAL
ncbi:MAG TPA: histidine phosphatase family protein [Candidatus Corynebacterium avicola]|uniref:Histidine phosphatase family protein n=1 Tax=Candidatus Corynebacterium avicola TaxID=2838527 RepID=A0A9D1RQI5_9CORY|nr:histidine phosphatase family protein [Candidatus Corynebacterium avicola]